MQPVTQRFFFQSQVEKPKGETEGNKVVPKVRFVVGWTTQSNEASLSCQKDISRLPTYGNICIYHSIYSGFHYGFCAFFHIISSSFPQDKNTGQFTLNYGGTCIFSDKIIFDQSKFDLNLSFLRIFDL